MGNNNSPLSLQKYAYADANPVDGNDPTGLLDFTLTGVLTNTAIGAGLGALSGFAIGAARAYLHGETNQIIWQQAIRGAEIGALFGAAVGAAAYAATAFLSQTFLAAITGTTVATATPLEIATANTLAQTFVGFHLGVIGFTASAAAYQDAVKAHDDVDAGIALAGMVMAGLGIAGARTRLYSITNVPTPKVYVIGRLPDTKPFIGKLGFKVLYDPNWTTELNDAWIRSAIESRSPVLFKSNPELESFFNTDPRYSEEFPTTVTSREVNQLLDAGYKITVNGDNIWLVPG